MNHAGNTDLRKDAFVSVVVVVDHTVSRVADVLTALEQRLSVAYTNYELVVVDNGMGAADLADVRRILSTVPCVRVQRLSRHFAYDTAIFSSIESAIGDYVVVMEAGRDPVEMVDQVVDGLMTGADIVQGISSTVVGGTLLERWGRSLFYWYNKRALGVEIPSRATYLTGFTRRAVNSLLSSGRQFRYLRHLMRHIGYSIVELTYVPAQGSRRRGILAGAADAVEMITSYSLHPLRAVSVGGMIVAAINLAYAVYVVVTFFAASGVEPGWTTTNLQLGIMFFFLFSILAVISEYVGRMLAETRREPPYFIMEELTSDRLIADEGRRNIV